MSIFKESKNGSVEAAEEQASTDVEKAVHVALGLPAAVADAVNDAVERWSDSSQREKDLKVLRERLESAVEVAERKGVEVRKQLPEQVERRLKVAEQRGDEVRKQAVEQARATRQRFEPTIRRVSDEARTRGKRVSDSTQEQLARVRERA